MRRPRGTAPDACHPAELAQAASACADCGVEPETLLHLGEVVAVYRGSRRHAHTVDTAVAAPAWPAAAAGATPVAVKVTRERWRGHPGAAELLACEHRALRGIEHPHIVRPECYAARDGAAVLVTEYLPGGDLVPLAGNPLPCWLGAARELASALAAVHAAGLVHGDVKARNVLFDGRGRAKLIDFGSACAIGAPLGTGGRTPAHIPLRLELTYAATAADVYAFAVLLYELLTGRLPFGPSPTRWSPPQEVDSVAEAEPLVRRIQATLEAATQRDLGTLIEFADVLESVHGKVAAPD